MPSLLFVTACLLALLGVAADAQSQRPQLLRTVAEHRPALLEYLATVKPSTVGEAYELHSARAFLAAEDTGAAALCAAFVAPTLYNGDISHKPIADLAHALLLAHSAKCDRPSGADLGEVIASLEDALPEEEPETLSLAHVRAAVYGVHALKLLGALPAEGALADHTRLGDVARAIMTLAEDDGTFRTTSEQTEGTLSGLADALETLVMLSSLEADFDWDEVVAVPLSELLEGVLTRATSVAKNVLAFTVDDEPSLKLTGQLFTALSNFARRTPLTAVTTTQVLGVARYLLMRSSPATVTDVFWLLTATNSLRDTPFRAPLVLYQRVARVSSADPEARFKVAVVDAIGEPVTVALKVEVIGGTLTTETGSLALTFDESDSTYALAVVRAAHPDLGVAELHVHAEERDTARYIPADGRFVLQVTGELAFTDANITVDRNTVRKSPADKTLTHITVSHTQTFVLAFSVVNKVDQRPAAPHQAFIRFTSATRDVTVPASQTPEQRGTYTTALNLERLASDFGAEDGQYRLSLLVGDSSSTAAPQWDLADCELSFGRGVSQGAAVAASPLKSQPVIEHRFQPTPARVSKPIWLAFTVLAALPLAVLVIALPVVGLNVSGLFVEGLALWCLVATAGALLVLYWLALTMLQALALLAALSVPTTLVGLAALRHMHAKHD
eukprot:TRINITY_DN4838_c1_g1_i1.p1 TRINITY_DN4838_c1_g1~~TRINITY_DN4838_c1_g1_i1.p1  ORF type:complete len:683 (+),score=184.55 TRINITY_DN4838_c1_g1_i1:33-2051(+)